MSKYLLAALSCSLVATVSLASDRFAECGEPAPEVVDRTSTVLYQVTLPAAREVDLTQPFSTWLVDASRAPVASASIAMHDRIATPMGTLDLCLPDRAYVAKAGQQVAVTHISWDPSRAGTHRFPLERAIGFAREQGLLATSQLQMLDAVDSETARDAAALHDTLREFAAAPGDQGHRDRLMAAIQEVRQLRSVGAQTLTASRFLSREQREAARKGGIEVPGRCWIYLGEHEARAELEACSAAQLAATWTATVVRDGANAGKRLQATPAFAHREVPDMTLHLNATDSIPTREMLYALLSELDGFTNVTRRDSH